MPQIFIVIFLGPGAGVERVHHGLTLFALKYVFSCFDVFFLFVSPIYLHYYFFLRNTFSVLSLFISKQ